MKTLNLQQVPAGWMLLSVPGLNFWIASPAEVLDIERLAAALVVTIVFTLAALWLRGVTASGAIAGAVCSFILYACAGPGGFAVLVAVFLLTLLATRLGYSKKQRLGISEKSGGRTASQVIANLSIAAASALLAAIEANSIFLLACIAALAEAAADTISSEYGQAVSQNPRLITTWQIVTPGTDGAISLAGTIAGLVGALVISGIAAVVRLLPWKWVALSAAAATMGMLLDSLLGASLERRRWLNNDAVNFLSTTAAALIVILLVRAAR
jgi:uncharacterized protein (TIGR00297 family)